MKKLLVVVIAVLFFLVSFLHGEKVALLTDVLKPSAIEVYDDTLYVVEGATFKVYPLKNAAGELTAAATFGRKGEGPGELKEVNWYPNRIQGLNGELLVEGMSKLIYFSKEGKHQREVKKKGFMPRVTPLGKNFVGIRSLGSEKKDVSILSLAVLDPQMKVIKEICQQEISDSKTEIPMVIDSIHFAVYNDKLYVEESNKGFVIGIYDAMGNRTGEIAKKMANPKVTTEDKEALFENFKSDNMVQMMAKALGGWDNFKKRMTFIYPETFPLIQDMVVTGDKIYVATFERTGGEKGSESNGKLKYIVMDLQGKILAESFMPTPPQSFFVTRAMGCDNRFYAIRKGTYYYIVENEEEEWELHGVRF